MRAKNIDIWLVSAITAFIIFANLFLAHTVAPFSRVRDGFSVESILVANGWVSSAPIVLAQNFKQVSVTHVGLETENGFGFNSQIQQVWQGGTVDYTEDPIDIARNAKLEELLQNKKYQSNAYCRVLVRDCDLLLVWDAQANTDFANFIGVKIGDTAFALVESELLTRITGVKP